MFYPMSCKNAYLQNSIPCTRTTSPFSCLNLSLKRALGLQHNAKPTAKPFISSVYAWNTVLQMDVFKKHNIYKDLGHYTIHPPLSFRLFLYCTGKFKKSCFIPCWLYHIMPIRDYVNIVQITNKSKHKNHAVWNAWKANLND